MHSYDLFGRTFTVTEANKLIHDTIEQMFYDMEIEGEISGFRPASSGHWYFTLKDSGAAIDAAVFRSAQSSMIIPENGDLVIAKGSLSYYERNGRLSFIIREMRKKGNGELLEIIEKRKAYYRSMGYFDEDRKKALPEEIRKLGVVTSASGAAIRDILNITKRRAPSLDIILFPATVQGEGAAESIAMRIRQANLFSACDVLIVGRGGGSAEDLSCFSEPEVIEAIHDSDIPIVSAVGHEIDWPISDYAADVRAPTPSAAAELVTERIFRRTERLDKALFAIDSLMRRRTADLSSRLTLCLHRTESIHGRIRAAWLGIPSTSDAARLLLLRRRSAEARLAFSEDEAERAMMGRVGKTLSILEEMMEEDERIIISRREAELSSVASLKAESSHAMKELLKDKESRLRLMQREVEALSPLSILSRGYSVTRKEDGTIIRKRGDAAPGEIIRTYLVDGCIMSTVKEDA